MPKTPSTNKQVPPDAFGQYRQTRFERTVRLTEKAIAKLEANTQTVTLTAVCEATRELEDKRKGLSPITILRNPKAAEYFRQHSPAYQDRQRQARRAKRKSASVLLNTEVRAVYRGLRSSDLIQMVEDLKAQLMDLKVQQEKLQTERDEAYQLRDQALQQNARQLMALTKLTPQAQRAGEKL